MRLLPRNKLSDGRHVIRGELGGFIQKREKTLVDARSHNVSCGAAVRIVTVVRRHCIREPCLHKKRIELAHRPCGPAVRARDVLLAIILDRHIRIPHQTRNHPVLHARRIPANTVIRAIFLALRLPALVEIRNRLGVYARKAKL